jgi:uncharacterized protein (DUF885 family)
VYVSSAIRLGFALLVAVSAVACSRADDPAAAADGAAASGSVTPDAAFAALSQRWLDGSMKLAPVNATQIGDHRFDAELDDLSAEGRNAVLDFDRGLLAALAAIDRKGLSRAHQVDAALLENQLRYELWSQQTLQEWAWNPMVYTGLSGSSIYNLMARDFAPMPNRLRAATARLEKLPELFIQMRVNLDAARVPAIHAETAAKQLPGVLSLVDEFITPQLDQLPAEDRVRLEAAIARLREAVGRQQKWMTEELVPNAQGDFRLGQVLYDQKLAFALNSPLSRADIRERAEAEIIRVRAEMYRIAYGVLNHAPPPEGPPTETQQQLLIEAALKLAYAERPERSQVVEFAGQTLDTASAFVREHDLVTMPAAPVDIILMPEFQRGVAVAYCDPPGPLDKGQKTFYAVSPIPDDWSAAQVDSFLREYNTRSIHELTIHEAMPGHFLQIAHANQYPSVLRAVLSSGSFVEGWAVYAEKLMADNGYLNQDPLFQLIQRKWYLRSVANAILDQAIHVDGMTREQAMKLMTVTTFQEEREAAGKWVRAQLTSAQLPTYFVGVQEHLAMRSAAEAAWGADFSLKRYHDSVLSFGSPPARYVRELLLDLPIE